MKILFAGFIPLLAPMFASGGEFLTPHLGHSNANLELPEQVVAAEGKLTLFADFSQNLHPGPVLYLVNRTSSEIQIPTQDGDPYIKLERQLNTGEWTRIQSHRYSDCGNSYIHATLPPGMHFKWLGFQPVSGKKAIVRFSSYSTLPDITSNTGEGVVDPAEAAAAATDQLSIRAVPSGIRQIFAPALGIGKTTLSSTVAALRMASELGEYPAIRAGAENWVSVLAAKSQHTAEEKHALEISRQILGKNWGPKTGLNHLLSICHQSLKSPEANSGFGSLGENKNLVWSTIAEIGNAHNSANPSNRSFEVPDLAIWTDIYRIAVENLVKQSVSPFRSQAKLLQNQKLVDEVVGDSALEKLLGGHIHSEAGHAAAALARRNKLDRLIELSPSLPPENRMMIFGVLGPIFQKRWIDPSSPAGLYWQRTIRERPFAAAEALLRSVNTGYTYANPFNRRNFDSLFASLEAEAKRSGPEAPDFELEGEQILLPQAIRFVGTWRNKQDVPLLKNLLHHNGYRETESLEEIEGKLVNRRKRSFTIRFAALNALKEIGESITEQPVIEKPIPEK